jgi:hypothetical protein
VPHVREVFPRHVEPVGVIEVAGGENQSATPDGVVAEAVPNRGDHSFAVAHGIHQPGVGTEPQSLGPGDPPVILERLLARCLGTGGHQRMIADLETLRRGEEPHAGRVVDDRVRDRAGVDHERIDPMLPGRDGTSQADRSGTHDEGILDRSIVFHSHQSLRLESTSPHAQHAI